MIFPPNINTVTNFKNFKFFILKISSYQCIRCGNINKRMPKLFLAVGVWLKMFMLVSNLVYRIGWMQCRHCEHAFHFYFLTFYIYLLNSYLFKILCNFKVLVLWLQMCATPNTRVLVISYNQNVDSPFHSHTTTSLHSIIITKILPHPEISYAL